jgi:hypothetical protein
LSDIDRGVEMVLYSVIEGAWRLPTNDAGSFSPCILVRSRDGRPGAIAVHIASWIDTDYQTLGRVRNP